jgi:hypothetical protein
MSPVIILTARSKTTLCANERHCAIRSPGLEHPLYFTALACELRTQSAPDTLIPTPVEAQGTVQSRNITSASEDHQRGPTEQAYRQVLSGNSPDNEPRGVTEDGFAVRRSGWIWRISAVLVYCVSMILKPVSRR